MNRQSSQANFQNWKSRNPFAPLRAAKYLGIAALAFTMTACQEEVGSESSKVDLVKTQVIVNNNSAELSQRVTMYGKKPVITRTADVIERITMPAAPTSVEYDYVMDESYEGWKAERQKNYYLPEGKVLTKQVKLNNNIYYIAGELTIDNYWTEWNAEGNCPCTGTIVILPGGKVNYPSRLSVEGLKILCYGDLEFTGTEKININRGSTVMFAGDFCATSELWVGGTLYVGDALSAPKLEVRENSICQAACGVVVDEYLIIHNYAELAVGSYLSSPSVEMNTGSVLLVDGSGLITTQALYMKNPCIVTVDGDDMEYAVLSADKIEINQSNVKDMFTGWLDIHYKEIDNRSGSELEWLSSIKHNGDTYLAEADCHPAFGVQPEVEPEKVIGLEHIAQIETPDHGHYISSTCIQTIGDKAYVSYHTRGSDYHGCIEVMNVTDGLCSIVSYMEHPTLDFNHLIVDGDRIIASGGEPKNGAFLGVIALGGGIFQTDAAELTQVELPGASSTCVTRNGDYLHATSNEGYHTLNAETFATAASIPTAGSSKFVYTDGTNMGVVSLTDKDSEQSLAELYMYSAEDYTFSAPTQTITLDVITPVNGKNVLNLEGNSAYICLGKNGVKRYADGVEVAAFRLDEEKAAANGLALDEKYLYVAYGDGGLFVLNKEDLSVVTSYRHSGGKSANYVSVSGDLLYVAYGLSGVQIFRLVEK